jgi:hypothetical protein
MKLIATLDNLGNTDFKDREPIIENEYFHCQRRIAVKKADRLLYEENKDAKHSDYITS